MEVRLPPTDFDAKCLKWRAFTLGCAFCSKNRYFSYPPTSRAPKRSKFRKIFGLKKFLLDLAINIIGPERKQNTPYSLSELNESGIVKRQSGSEKLKYVLKFYIGGYTSRDIAHAQWLFSIVSISTWCLGRYISETIKLVSKGPTTGTGPSRIQWSRNWWRQVTLEGQGRNPRWCQLSRKWLAIATQWQ